MALRKKKISPAKKLRRKPEVIRAQVLAAIERLKNNAPENTELRAELIRGKLRFNEGNVIIESGVGRSTLNGPTYADLKEQIKNTKEELARNPKTKVKSVTQSQQTIKDLEQELNVHVEQVKSHWVNVDRLEYELRELGRSTARYKLDTERYKTLLTEAKFSISNLKAEISELKGQGSNVVEF